MQFRNASGRFVLVLLDFKTRTSSGQIKSRTPTSMSAINVFFFWSAFCFLLAMHVREVEVWIASGFFPALQAQ